MRRPTSRYLSLLILTATVLLAGCTNPATPAERDVDGDDADVGVHTDTSAPEDTSDTPDVEREDAGFVKPPPDPTAYEIEYRPPDYDEDRDSGSTFGRAGREHMHPTQHLFESWLYVDEYFVCDGLYAHYGDHQWMPGDAQVFAVHEGEYLPMRFVHVTEEDGFPSMAEIESWDDEDFGYVDSVPFESGVPVNYTVVIPPWAFPEEGAYQIQLIFVPDWEPIPGPYRLRTASTLRSWTHTIYYGGEEFVSTGENVSSRQDVSTSRELMLAKQHMSRNRGVFLAPPTDIYDWVSVGSPTGSTSDIELAQTFEVSEPQVTLELHLGGVNALRVNTIGQNLYYIRQDETIIDMFIYETTELVELTEDKPPTDVLPIDVDLPANEDTTVQVFAAPFPYEASSNIFGTHVQDSNALILRYTPDNGKEDN